MFPKTGTFLFQKDEAWIFLRYYFLFFLLLVQCFINENQHQIRIHLLN